jgi:hypothetical protein
MSNRYHAAIHELVRAFEAEELTTADLEVLAKATSKRLDPEATIKSGLGHVSQSELGKGFMRALRRSVA